VREEHAARVGGPDAHARGDGVRSPPDVDRDRLGHVRGVRIINVTVARLARLWPRRGQDLPRRPVVERKALVDARVVEPQALQLLEQLGPIRREVPQLGAVLGQMVELPLVLVEAVPSGKWRVERARQPAVVVECPLT